ncbi:Anaerobic nitric oxide reductase transcription regulator NorR [subsurface metagenome]
MDKEKIKVLLIEDDASDLYLIKKMLAEEGGNCFSLEHADNLSEGLVRLNKTDFDVVLLDLGLPDSWGLETFITIHARAPQIPIVVLSGLDDKSLAINAVHNGAQDYLVKGDINSAALQRCLRYAIERKQSQKALWIKDRVIESSVNSIAITDLQGHLTYANDSLLKLWEYESIEDIIGKGIEELWYKIPKTPWITETVLSSGSWIGKIRGKKKAGTNLDLQLSAFIVTENDNLGEPLCMVFSFVDITEVTRLRRRLKTEQSFAGIVGRDTKMLELFDTIRQVADVNIPVLIQGESGTGKELVAAAIHNEGPSSDKLYVPVNCGALPEGVLESELFGHVKGAFTGAVHDRKGRFELANGGTIFLDEIGDIPGAMQVKLLRVLQEGIFQRVGGEENIKVNVRVISATNKNLAEEVAAGRFREDLFYRLCVVPVYLPPLRERRNDIPLLAEHLLKKALTEVGREDVGLSPEAVDVMMDYDWPGNVRELENALRYALVKCRDNLILPEHFPSNILKTTMPTQLRPTKARKKRKHKLDMETVWRILEETGGNKFEAAHRLGVSRSTLYRFLEESEKTSKITV